jgi:hypothetical protein
MSEAIRLIKPNETYAGLPLGDWLKRYWEFTYPLIGKSEKPDHNANQSGAVIFAAGKYAHAFDDPQPIVRRDKDNVERYQITTHRGVLVTLVKFIATEAERDGSNNTELSNVARSLALNSDVIIKVEYGKVEEGKIVDPKGERLDKKTAMQFYGESYEIDLPSPRDRFTYSTGTTNITNKAASASFFAIFEFTEPGTYRINVDAAYIFRWNGREKRYSPLRDDYEITVSDPIELLKDWTSQFA